MDRYKLKMMASMAIFGTIGLFVRYIPLSSSLIAFFRGITGSLFLLCVLLFKKQSINIKSIKNSLFPLILSGIFIGINWILLFESYRYTTIATATLCYYFAPIFVLIASYFLFKERLSLRQSLCILIAFIGMIFVSGILEISSFQFSEITGVLLGLSAAIFYATVIILNKYIKNINSFDKTIIQLLSASLIMGIYILFTKEYKYISINYITGLMLLCVGIIHTGLAYFMYFSSIEYLDSQSIGLLSYLDPIIAIILSVCILNESLSLLSLIGAILVLGSTCINELLNK